MGYGVLLSLIGIALFHQLACMIDFRLVFFFHVENIKFNPRLLKILLRMGTKFIKFSYQSKYYIN